MSMSEEKRARRHAKRVRRYEEVAEIKATIEVDEDGEPLRPLDLTNAEQEVWVAHGFSVKRMIQNILSGQNDAKNG